MRSRGVAKMMFLNVRCVLQDRIGLNDISPYFLYLLLCIWWRTFKGCRASHGKFLRTRKEALRELNTCATCT